MNWIAAVLLAVAFFVTGMLCLVKAQRVRSQMGAAKRSLGIYANFMMAFLSAVLALVAIGVSKEYREGFGEIFTTPVQRWYVLPWIIAFGALFFLGNMLYFDGLVSAPNAGYARALMTVEVIALTLLAALLFGDEIEVRQFIGAVLVSVGAVLVSF